MLFENNGGLSQINVLSVPSFIKNTKKSLPTLSINWCALIALKWKSDTI